jgi:hypothetical protein
MKMALLFFMSVIFISGCAGRFRGPSGDAYYVHSSRNVLLFKIKSPYAAWYTNKNFYAGKNEAIIFDNAGSKSRSKYRVGGRLTADFEYGRFLDDKSYFLEKLELLRILNSEGVAINFQEKLRNSGRELIDFKGAHCVVLNYEIAEKKKHEVVVDGYGKKNNVIVMASAEVGRIIECPGFFRKTFGVLQISIALTADTLEEAKLAFKEKDADFKKSYDSFKFVTPFTQKVQAGFSIENQLKMAGGRWYFL